MRINADFDQAAVAHSERMPWQASPMAGVSRRMLDRIGDELARATSIVRYAPGSHFSPHTHDGGEEFLVLDGVFQDEHGDFPAGTYVRNPIGTRHQPSSEPGCDIFVKLWQFGAAEIETVRIDTRALELAPDPARPGASRALLYADERERVHIEQWNNGAELSLGDAGGMELLVLEGGFALNGEQFEKHSWLRLPINYQQTATVGAQGARVWSKTGHLRHVIEPGKPSEQLNPRD